MKKAKKFQKECLKKVLKFRELVSKGVQRFKTRTSVFLKSTNFEVLVCFEVKKVSKKKE